MTAAPASRYAAKPWLALLSDAQRAPITPVASLVHALRRAVAETPERAFLASFDGRLTYREVDELSDSVAGHLAARGLERGDRVAILLQNSPHFVLALLGAWKAGATVVPVNPMYKSGEVTHVLPDGDVAALICSDRVWESYLRETAAESPVRIVLTGCELDFQIRHDARVLTFERLPQADDTDDLTTVARAGHKAPEGRDPAPSDIALISHTSGTSGTPKGATNTHGDIMYNAERQRTGLELPEAPAYFALAPLFHITGVVCQLGACLDSAGTLVLAHRFEAGVVLDAFAEHGPHHTVGPSTAFMALAAHPAATRDHFASFRMPSTRSPARSPWARRVPRRSYGSSTTRARRSPSASRARSSCAVRRSSPATGGAPTPPPRPSRTVSCAPATSASWTNRAGCTSSTARRT